MLFSVLGEDAYNFLIAYVDRLYNLVLVGNHGAYYTNFQLDLAARHWWRAHLNFRPAGSHLLTWIQFSQILLEKYRPHTLRDCLKHQFLRLEQGSMIVMEYEDRFHDLDRHATSICTTKYERIHGFIQGLRLPFYMSTPILVVAGRYFAEVFNHTHVIEQMHHQALGYIYKRPQYYGNFNRTHSVSQFRGSSSQCRYPMHQLYYHRGQSSSPIQAALLIINGY